MRPFDVFGLRGTRGEGQPTPFRRCPRPPQWVRSWDPGVWPHTTHGPLEWTGNLTGPVIEGTRMANRLASATSPYLLQHADNPVDWWEWGPEAFAEARRRNVPVLLQRRVRRVPLVPRHGARVVRGRGDRGVHERALRQRQGRPRGAARRRRGLHAGDDRDDRARRLADDRACSTTTATPFFAGTYFPDQPRHGQPVVPAGAAGARRGLDEPAATRCAGSAARCASTSSGRRALAGGRAVDARRAGRRPCRRWRASSTPAHAGFGTRAEVPAVDGAGVPAAARRRDRVDRGRAAADARRAPARRWRAAASTTSSAAGSRATRVDRGWVVPHFEKMLYDNAQLVGLYARWGGDRSASRVARETADFMLRELGTAEGGFASALDADSEGVEGKFYAWTPGRARARCSATTTAPGRRGCSRSPRPAPSSTAPRRCSCSRDPDDAERWADVRQRLLAARAERVRPARDDKVVAAWNGLAISGLVRRRLLLGRPDVRRRRGRGRRSCWSTLHLGRTAGCAGSRATASPGRTPACWRTTAASRRASSPCCQATGDPVWLDRGRTPARRRR